jgi:hypothetical protein
VKAIWIAALLSSTLWAADTEDSKVPVCVGAGSISADFVLNRARDIAGKMFAEIGVTLVWRGSHGCPADAIRITFSQKTSPMLLPGAFAYALPYEGAHMEVFYDRVLSAVAEPRRVPPLLAHVLVHEITHILGGSDHHSATGVMKTRWDERDYQQMASHPLQFTSIDVALIRAGLAHRRSLQATQPASASH